MNNRPEMHFHKELLEDKNYVGFLSDELLLKWTRDAYSTSKHLLTLYNIPIGLKARTIVEIGFGRSSLVLAKAAAELGADYYCCDNRDFSYLLNEDEKRTVRFIHGNADLLWNTLDGKGIDFAFLDYFSDPSLETSFILKEIRKCFSLLRTNGIIAIHDSIDPDYQIGKAIQQLGHGGLFQKKEMEYLSLPYNYGLALIRKTSHSAHGILPDQYPKKEEQSQ